MIEQALKLVNDARTVIGQSPLTQLPKGIPSNCDACVVANALDARTGGTTVGFFQSEKEKARAIGRAWGTTVWFEPTYDRPWRVLMPCALTTFIDAFDHGQFPELIDA